MTPTQAITLSELARTVSQAVTEAFGSRSFWVIADLTNHTYKASSNYHFFELVEKEPNSNNLVAKLSGKAWGEASKRIVLFEQTTGQQFKSNIRVLIKVNVQFHAAYGLQCNLADIDASFTLGELAQQRQQTLQRLVTENPGFIEKVADRYVTRNNQLRLNKVIQRIAVIASPISAGLQDFKHTLEHNTHKYRFYADYYFTSVQGDVNAKYLEQQIVDVYHAKRDYDAVVIIRGGGSETDFLIFDNYLVARVVARFPIPVITGIGHQKNETITDLMAHSPTKTPTQAAEFIIAHNNAFEDELLSFQQSVVLRTQQAIAQHFQQLGRLNTNIVNQSRTILNACGNKLAKINQATVNASRVVVNGHYRKLAFLSTRATTRPVIIISRRQQELVNKTNILRYANRRYLASRQQALRYFSAVVTLMSPINLLHKGFAIIKSNGVITVDAGQIKTGSNISVILSGTEITATVISKSPYNGNGTDI